MHVLCRDPHVHIDAIKLAVEQHPDTLAKANGEGFRPVHIAAMLGADIGVIYYLLQQCPDALLGQMEAPPHPTNSNNNAIESEGRDSGNSHQDFEALLQAHNESLGAENKRLRAQIESLQQQAGKETQQTATSRQ